MLSRVLRHSTVYVVASAVQRGIPIVLLPVAASELPDVSIGAIALGALLAGAVSLISTLGFNLAVIRYRADEAGISTESWSLLFVAQVGWSIVVGLGFVAASWAWLPWDAAGGGQALAYGAIALGTAQSWLQMAMASYRARQRPGGYLTISAAVFVVSVPVTVVLTQHSGAAGYLWGLAIGAAIPAVAGIMISTAWPTFDRRFLFGALALAAPFMVHWAATWVLVGFDRFVIDRHLGLAATGVFYLAFVYASVPLLIAQSFGIAWLPAFLSRDVGTEDLGRVVAVVSFGVAGVVLIALGAAVVVMPALYEALDPTVLPLMAVLAPIAVVRVPHIVATAPIVRSHRTAILGLSSVAAAVLDVVVVILVIGSVGLEGAAWAKVAAFAVASVWVWMVALPRVDWSTGLVSVVSGIALCGLAFTLMKASGEGFGTIPTLSLFTIPGVAAIAMASRVFAVHFRSPDVERQGVNDVG